MKILLCAFVLLLLPANCLGQGPITLPDQSFSAGPDIENAATGASTINQNPPGSVAHHLTERFYRAVKHSYDNGFVPAYDEFTQLRAVAQRHGYESMPDFSFELLNRARRSAEEGHAEEASRLVSIAALLSSRDPRVNFAAASFYQVIGVRRAVSCVLRGLRQMVTYPVLFGLCAVNLFLALLLAFTVSFFTVCVVQLVRSGEELLALCVSFSRGRYRLLIGRSMLLLL
ncbi:MAG TPA: hypothetical protein PLP17_05030, partial [Oligoflexia bacterium]|nr:hypothetical protein [Oligoflexia bacterium]